MNQTNDSTTAREVLDAVDDTALDAPRRFTGTLSDYVGIASESLLSTNSATRRSCWRSGTNSLNRTSTGRRRRGPEGVAVSYQIQPCQQNLMTPHSPCHTAWMNAVRTSTRYAFRTE